MLVKGTAEFLELFTKILHRQAGIANALGIKPRGKHKEYTLTE